MVLSKCAVESFSMVNFNLIIKILLLYALLADYVDEGLLHWFSNGTREFSSTYENPIISYVDCLYIQTNYKIIVGTLYY